MSPERRLGILALVMVYALGVSFYVAYSMTGTLSGSTSSLPTVFALYTFGSLLAGGVVFALMVALLDVLTRRPQQFIVALALGLAASATFEVVTQIAFVQSYAYWKFERGQSPTDGKSH